MKENSTIEWDEGGKIGNKNKLIVTYIPQVQGNANKQHT